MSRGGCPTRCPWMPNADDARWVTCGECGIERVDPVVRDRETTQAARRVEVAPGATQNTNGAQKRANRTEGAA